MPAYSETISVAFKGEAVSAREADLSVVCCYVRPLALGNEGFRVCIRAYSKFLSPVLWAMAFTLR